MSLVNTTNKKTIRIFYQNVRGLKTKLQSAYINIQSEDYDIICLTETWLSNDIFDTELFDTDYEVIRLDRSHEITKKKRGGGVLLALKQEFKFRTLDHLENMSDKFESVCVRISGPLKLDLCLVYFPYQKLESIKTFIKLIEKRDPNLDHNLLFLGDFNINCITGPELPETVLLKRKFVLS